MTLVVDTTAAKVPTTPVTVSVNGVVIARETIVREMQHHPAEKPIAAWQAAARALAIRELLLQRARHLGLNATPESDEAGRRETEEEALIRTLLEGEVAVPEPDDATCRRYYDNNRACFRSAVIYEAAHILFAAAADDDSAYDKARVEAERVLATLHVQPSAFAELAQVYSRCPSGLHGGNLGQITAGQTTPEFEAALVVLEPGQLCGTPVATRYGFHIIRLDRKHDGEELPYEAVKHRVADYLRESVRRRAEVQYIARLVSAARIEGIDLAGADALRVH